MTPNEVISAEFPYKPAYESVLGSKIAYIDEGQGDPILLLHGNPTSSYLWRNIIPHLTSLGRCIAPDLIGMGQSDKPTIDYRFFDHVQNIDEFIKTLDLKNITLVGHGWGGVIGFHYARRHENNVKGLAFMETLLAPYPSWEIFPEEWQRAFQALRTPDVGWDMLVNQNLFIEKLLPGGVLRLLTQEEMSHYRRPFEQPSSRKPIWRWPNESPIAGEPSDVAEAVTHYNQWLQHSPLPKLLLYATPGDLIDTSLVEWCAHRLTNLKSAYIGEGRHFIQEDHPHQIGIELANWLSDVTP